MLKHIPTHIIAGPLGAGKTTLIRHLMRQRPAAERWAILINEFGQVGLDAALLLTEDDAIAIGEVAGGCLCCVNGAPFQVGLARLLRKVRPHRVFIEPSGLGHPLQLLRQLNEAPWRGVLAVQPLVMVLEGTSLVDEYRLPCSQQDALQSAALVVVSRAEQCSAQQRAEIGKSMPPGCTVNWEGPNKLSFSELPRAHASSIGAVDKLINPLPSVEIPPEWQDLHVPVVQISEQSDAWSIGWKWSPALEFDCEAVSNWLASLAYQRAKLVIHSSGGWVSANAVGNSTILWRPSEWRRDSRLELIFAMPQDAGSLNDSLPGLYHA